MTLRDRGLYSIMSDAVRCFTPQPNKLTLRKQHGLFIGPPERFSYRPNPCFLAVYVRPANSLYLANSCERGDIECE